jgi:hypothetical protein
MNSAEHIVESYFRLCRGCFTLPDRKVLKGNNRQLDILAYNLKEKLQFHIEVDVTHQLNWCPTRRELGQEFEGKFFGAPPKRTSSAGNKTDYEKGKSYFSQIENTYLEVGFSPASVKRVWVCWVVKGEEKAQSLVLPAEHLNKTYGIEVLSLRNKILPELEHEIGTANYDDEILRTIGFIKQRESQTGK